MATKRKCCRHPANLHGDTFHRPDYGAPCQAIVNGLRMTGDNSKLTPCSCPGWDPGE